MCSSDLVLVCERQLAGRGRRGNVWYSWGTSSLTFSVLWNFKSPRDRLVGLGLLAALCVASTLDDMGVQGVQLKWPNDIYLHGAKLGGVLTELGREWDGMRAAVVGVGLNISMPSQLRSRIGREVSDLSSVAGIVSRTQILGNIVALMAEHFPRFDRHGFAVFQTEWMRRMCWRGEVVQVLENEKSLDIGECQGVSEDGALLQIGRAHV